MPDLTSYASTLRAGGYHFTGFLATVPQAVVLGGTISATPAFPTKQLAYTVDSGDYTDVVAGMTIRVYDSGGTFKGLLRVATGQSVTSTVMPVNEFSANTVNAVSGDTFEVINEWRIHDKLVSATSKLNKDSRITYTDQGSDPYPTCCSGGPIVGFVSGSSLVASAYGSTSMSNDPDNGGNSLDHDWDFGDATPSTSTDDDPADVEFPEGFRWVTHVVTDGVNGTATTQHIPAWAFGDTYQPLYVQMRTREWTKESGWTATFALPRSGEAALASLPDGALIVYFEAENFNGTPMSLGADVTGRSHIKHVGFLRQDSIRFTPDATEIEFKAESPLGVLARTPALAQLGISGTSSNWNRIKSLSVRRFLFYLWFWHTTFGDSFDTVFLDGSDLTYSRLAVQNIPDIAAQLRDIAQALQVDVTCDALGRVLFVRDPNMLSLSDRSGRTTAYNATFDDLLELELTRQHAGTTKQVKASGITTSGSPVFSKAGGAPSSLGTGVDQISRLIVPDAATLYRYTGLRFARVNGIYKGQFVPQGATVRLPDGYDIFEPALRQFITLTVPAASNDRGVSFDTTTRWTIESMTVEYDAETGAKSITATIDHETFGPDGVYDKDEAKPGTSGLPSYTPPNIAYTPPLFTVLPTGGVLVSGIQRLGLVLDDGTLALTANYDAASPTYVVNIPTGAPAGVQQWCLDASDTTQGWVVTGSANGVYKYSAINTLSPVATQQTPSIAAGTHNIDASFGTLPGDFAVIAVRGSGVVKLYTTLNGDFTSISSVDITGAVHAQVSGLFLNSRTGKMYAAGPASGNFAIFESTNLGVSWTQIGSFSPNFAISSDDIIADIYMPYADLTGKRLYHRWRDGISDTNTRLYRWEVGGGAGAWVDVSPLDGSYSYGPSGAGRFGIGMASASLDRMLLPGYSQKAGKYGVFFGTGMEGTPTWQTAVTPDTALNMPYRRAALLDPDGIEGILFGESAQIAGYDPATNTVVDKVGNLAGLTSAAIVAVFGWKDAA